MITMGSRYSKASGTSLARAWSARAMSATAQSPAARRKRRLSTMLAGEGIRSSIFFVASRRSRKIER